MPDHPRVCARLDEIHAYANADKAPAAALVLLAKLDIVLSNWIDE